MYPPGKGLGLVDQVGVEPTTTGCLGVLPGLKLLVQRHTFVATVCQRSRLAG